MVEITAIEPFVPVVFKIPFTITKEHGAVTMGLQFIFAIHSIVVLKVTSYNCQRRLNATVVVAHLMGLTKMS